MRLIATLSAFGLIALGFTLALILTTPERPPLTTSTRTRLIVPVPCIDALEHGDDLVSLTGETFAAAAREDDDLNDLLHRATTTTEDYKRDAARCRAHATP